MNKGDILKLKSVEELKKLGYTITQHGYKENSSVIKHTKGYVTVIENNELKATFIFIKVSSFNDELLSVYTNNYNGFKHNFFKDMVEKTKKRIIDIRKIKSPAASITMTSKDCVSIGTSLANESKYSAWVRPQSYIEEHYKNIGHTFLPENKLDIQKAIFQSWLLNSEGIHVDFITQNGNYILPGVESAYIYECKNCGYLCRTINNAMADFKLLASNKVRTLCMHCNAFLYWEIKDGELKQVKTAAKAKKVKKPAKKFILPKAKPANYFDFLNDDDEDD